MEKKFDEYIGLKNSDILRLGIQDEKGVPTGEYLEFDLEDIELPFKYQDLQEKDKKNRMFLQNQFLIIDKKEDHKGKKLMSSNQEAKMKVLKEFFNKEAEIYNIFLGENGVQKLLNGRKLRWTTLLEIDEIIEKVIAPKLDITMDNIQDKIKNKYSKSKDKEVLK